MLFQLRTSKFGCKSRLLAKFYILASLWSLPAEQDLVAPSVESKKLLRNVVLSLYVHFNSLSRAEIYFPFFFNGLFIMNAFVLKLSCKSFAMHDLHGSINTKMMDRVTIHRNKNITLCTWCTVDANINHRESAARIVVLSCYVID